MDMMSSNSAGSSEPSSGLHSGGGTYCPLDKLKSEFRLLTLSIRQNQPNGTEELHASIEIFSLDSGNIPVYHALSYEWNPPNSPSTMTVLIIDGMEKQMSENLHYALMCLGVSTRFTGRFWVDALCINQEDAAERSSQVQLMQRIYGEALCVFVWPGIRWVVEVGQRTASLLKEYATLLLEDEEHLRWVVGLRRDENYKDHWKAINSLFSQSYWNRSWIIQEVVAANGAYLLTNGDPIPSSFISLDALMYIFSGPLTEISLYDRSTNWAAIPLSTDSVDETAVRRRMDAHTAVDAIACTKKKVRLKFPDHHNDLLSLLARFCGQLATDPRDKVYSLLGLEEPNSDNSIKVDYTLKWTEIFRDAAIHVIRDRNDLEILVYAGSNLTELPSWVPNWLDQERQGTTRFQHGKYCLRDKCCSPHTAQTPLRTDCAGHRLPTISADCSLLSISATLFNIELCSKVDSPEVDMETRKIWAPLGELGDIFFSTTEANSAILDDSDPELLAEGVFANFLRLWWHAIFYFYPHAKRELSQLDFYHYVTSSGRQSLMERQRELLQRALDEQFPFLTKVPPSVGSAIFRSNIKKMYAPELVAKRILDRQVSIYIPGMCFRLPDCGTLGPHHVLASVPLCRFPIILSKLEEGGKGYKVTSSARVATLEHGQIPQNDGTTFEVPVQEIDLV